MSMEKAMKEAMINEVKIKPLDEKVKLVGLYKLLNDVYKTEEGFDKKSAALLFQTQTKQKALFYAALDIYKANTTFNKNAVKDLKDFFTETELSSPDFDKSTTTPSTSIFLPILEKIDLINSLITDEDRTILKHLENIDITRSQDTFDFQIEFTFSKNEFFKNDKLKIELSVENGDENPEKISKVTSTPIEWFPGKDIRQGEVSVKSKNKKNKKPVIKMQKKESFFWVFKDHTRPDEKEEDEEEDPEEMDEFSDENLYLAAVDTFSTLERHLYEFTIPLMLGVEVDAFKMGPDFDEEEDPTNKALNTGDKKPDCKQQ